MLGALYAASVIDLRQPNQHRLFILAGIFCGAAIGTKLTALIPAFLLGVGLIPMMLLRGFEERHGHAQTNTDEHGRELGTETRTPIPQSPIPSILLSAVAALSRRRIILHPLSFILLLLLIPSPWLIKSFVLHGNPVYPAAYNTFGGPEWSAETNDFYNDRAAQRGFGRSAADFIASPIDITLRWSRMPGDVPSDFIRQEANERGLPSRLLMRNSPGFEEQNPGPAPLALLPLALITIFLAIITLISPTSRGGRAPSPALGPTTLILALQLFGGWIAWFFTYQSTRFALVPLTITIILAIPIIVHLARTDLSRWIARVTLLLCALTGFAWFSIYSLFVNPTAFIALGFIDRELVLESRFNAWPAVRHLNAETNGEGVLYIGEHRGFHAQYPVVLSDWFDEPLVLVEIRATTDNAALLRRWQDAGVRYVLLNQAELSLYEEGLFRPRFSPVEWQRFTALREHLLSGPAAITFRDPNQPIYVIDLQLLPPDS